MGSRKNWSISLNHLLTRSAFDVRGRNGVLGCLRNEKGSQAIEFIGVLPLFLLMVIVVWQFALAAAAAVTAKHAAMEGARAAMVEEVHGTNVETAVRNAASSYEVSRITKQNVDGEYVKVSVTLNAPLLNARIFQTDGLKLPITAEVTVRKEKKK